MNLIKNKKKDVKQFLQEMKVNKTIRSSNQNSINNSISSQLKSSPIQFHQQEKFNSNGISQRTRYDKIDSRRKPNLDTVRGYNSPNPSNSQYQRNIPFSNVNSINRMSQNLNQQHPIYYPPERSFYHESFGPIHQSSPIYLPNESNSTIMSQNLQKPYITSQNSEPFYSNNQFYDHPYLSRGYQQNQNNRQHYASKNQVNLAKNFSFFRDSGVSYNSQKNQNYNYSPILQPIHKDIVKNQHNLPKQPGSYYSQKIQINNYPSYETIKASRPHQNLSQLSYQNHLQMQQIRQTSVDQSSSDKNTPGKISQISMKKRNNNHSPISKIQELEDYTIKNNFNKKESYFQNVQNMENKNKINIKQVVKRNKNNFKVSQQNKAKMKKIINNQKQTQKVLDKILAQLNIFYQNLSRDRKQFSQNFKQNGKYKNILQRKYKSPLNVFNLPVEQQVQLQKIEFCDNQFNQFEEQIQI